LLSFFVVDCIAIPVFSWEYRFHIAADSYSLECQPLIRTSSRCNLNCRIIEWGSMPVKSSDCSWFLVFCSCSLYTGNLIKLLNCGIIPSYGSHVISLLLQRIRLFDVACSQTALIHVLPDLPLKVWR
jgi:hypothetical protein